MNSPVTADELAGILRSACGGDAEVEATDEGFDIWVKPASGGYVFARIHDLNSPVLAGLLGVYPRLPLGLQDTPET